MSLHLHIPADAHPHQVIRPEALEAHTRRIAAIEEMQQALMALLTFDAVVPGADRAGVELRGWNAIRSVQREGLPGMISCPTCAEGFAP